MGKRTKHLPHGTFRVISVSQEAAMEFVYESIIDRFGHFFDVIDGTKMTVQIDWNTRTGDFFFAIHDDRDDISIDVNKAKKVIGYTTPSLLSPQEPYYVDIKENDKGEYELSGQSGNK